MHYTCWRLTLFSSGVCIMSLSTLPSHPSLPSTPPPHRSIRCPRDDSSKRKARRKQQNAKVEDAEIVGVERTGLFEPGDGGALNSKQDDFILKKLFKKSGMYP